MGSLRGAKPLFSNISPPLLSKERGIKGVRLIKTSSGGAGAGRGAKEDKVI